MSTMPVDLPPIEMPQVLIYSEACTALRIPASAMNFEGFLAWKESNEFPKQGRISWVNGGLRIDMNAEEFESHSRVKGRIYATLLQHVEKHDLGMIFPDGFSLFNEPTRWQTDPDAMFIAWDTYANKQAEFRVNK